jgi:hypothetical protein
MEIVLLSKTEAAENSLNQVKVPCQLADSILLFAPLLVMRTKQEIGDRKAVDECEDP